MNGILLVLFSIILILMVMVKNCLNEIKNLRNHMEKSEIYYLNLLKQCRKYVLPKTKLREDIDKLVDNLL